MRWRSGSEFTVPPSPLSSIRLYTTMQINDFQTAALNTAIYPDRGANFAYPALGLAGEAGEVCDKLKKVIRDNDGVLTDPVREAVAKELGDTAWYLAVLAWEIDYTLEEILQMNLDKLQSRQQRGVLSGSGDSR